MHRTLVLIHLPESTGIHVQTIPGHGPHRIELHVPTDHLDQLVVQGPERVLTAHDLDRIPVLWTVGHYTKDAHEPSGGVSCWTLCGVFLTEQEAMGACLDMLHFYQRWEIGQPVGHEMGVCVDADPSGHFPKACRENGWHAGPCVLEEVS